MKRFKRLLVGLNLSDQDKTVIHAAGKIAQLFKSEKVFFLHVAERPMIPEEIAKEYPETAEPAKKRAERIMSESIGRHFIDAPMASVTHEIIEGRLLDMLLQHISQKDIDLAVVGRKRRENTSGHITEKVARKAPCSVLVIPEGDDLALENILVGTDFSPYSKDAMDTALAFAQGRGSSKITCLHVIEYGGHGEQRDVFLELLRKVAGEDFDKFMRQLDSHGLSIRPVIMVSHNAAKVIRDFSWRHKMDLIIVGVKGRTAAAAMLLGSVTENLIRIANTPILAIKRKGENMNLLKAFFTK